MKKFVAVCSVVLGLVLGGHEFERCEVRSLNLECEEKHPILDELERAERKTRLKKLVDEGIIVLRPGGGRVVLSDDNEPLIFPKSVIEVQGKKYRCDKSGRIIEEKQSPKK